MLPLLDQALEEQTSFTPDLDRLQGRIC